MAKVAIVMGSDSDMPVMSKAADFLEEMGIDFEMTIISAHREPDIFFEWAKGAEERGVRLSSQVQGKQHIFRECVQHCSHAGHRNSDENFRSWGSGFSLLHCSDAGRSSGCIRAINGGQNAGILAAQILASSDAGLLQKLKDYRTTMKESVVKKADKLDQVGYKNYE